ncbi:hypothetical protein Pcinc_030964 [Petrolisthes cinctipes]|uniref:Uncharacterized protein n=1 Tax=Petrolisthes cinctipes TaxID=88211 RepID=A0AAE1EX19_PETCI|nr:hypothetical protein Pcinc_030964 [Petrolisthes cinctipes]
MVTEGAGGGGAVWGQGVGAAGGTTTLPDEEGQPAVSSEVNVSAPVRRSAASGGKDASGNAVKVEGASGSSLGASGVVGGNGVLAEVARDTSGASQGASSGGAYGKPGEFQASSGENMASGAWSASSAGWRRCGDWSGRLKLLRYQSSSNTLTLTFRSDHAHAFIGFRARVSAHTGQSNL